VASTSTFSEVHSVMKPVVEIRPYRTGDGVAFRELNEAWIGKYFGIEEKDRSTLGDPERYILQPGGHIFMATAGDEAVGCCALLLMHQGVYEVAKMTVAEGYRGQGAWTEAAGLYDCAREGTGGAVSVSGDE
jgi:putative acetyltransferase